MLKKRNLIVGAGFSGAVLAQQIASELGESVLLVDKKSHIAGLSYDYKNKDGLWIHKYGPHIFHTNIDKVWEYLKKYSEFNHYSHRVNALVDGKMVPLPFNFNTIDALFPEEKASSYKQKLKSAYPAKQTISILEFLENKDPEISALANYIYEKIFLNYTIKQWGKKPEDIDKSITARVPVVLDYDNRYFHDKYQGIPQNGYTNLIKNILDEKNVEVLLNTNYKSIIDSEDFERIFITGSIDEYFDYKYGVLPYRSVEYKFEKFDSEFYQNVAMTNYPNDFDYKRIHEYKHYLNETPKGYKKTIIAKEYFEEFELNKNERYYPSLDKDNIKLHSKYLEDVKQFKNLYFFGRLGDYKYYNMDSAINRAFEVFDYIKKR